MDTILGFLTYLYKLVFLVPGLIVNSILTQIAVVGQQVNGITEIPIVTLEDILFNRVALVDVNIFSPTQTATGMTVSGTITQIRVNIAGWYVAFRNLALTVSFATLVYIGIKIGLESSGEKRARYKQMLIHWLTGFALIFVLHYFISFVLRANSALVNMFEQSQISTGDYANILLAKAFDVNLVKSWGAAIMYSILLVITLIFLIIYIKRMLMTCFLIMIAPLITITYSIDKVGNNRSEILNQWMKEFCYNVLIQPFHCIVYIVFIGAAVEKLVKDAEALNFGALVYAIVCMLSIFIGEKIIRQIFGFTKSKSVASKLFSGAMITQAIKDVKQIRNARGSREEEEETEAPPIMPSGVDTETASAQAGIKTSSIRKEDTGIDKTVRDGKASRDKERINKKADSSETGILPEYKQVKKTRMQETIRKVQEHTPTIIRDIGSGYVNGIKTVTGVRAFENHQYKKTHKPTKTRDMSKFRKQFLLASDMYARENGFSKKQLDWKIQELRRTSFDKLENNSDRIYKMWIDKMDKDLLKGGAKDVTKAMKSFIDDKYET